MKNCQLFVGFINLQKVHDSADTSRGQNQLAEGRTNFCRISCIGLKLYILEEVLLHIVSIYKSQRPKFIEISADVKM